MLLRTPNKGEEVFEYLPQNLGNHRKKYTKITWFDTTYFHDKLNAGVLYETEAEVQQRVLEEKALCLLRQKGGMFNLLDELEQLSSPLIK